MWEKGEDRRSGQNAEPTKTKGKSGKDDEGGIRSGKKGELAARNDFVMAPTKRREKKDKVVATRGAAGKVKELTRKNFERER